MFRAEYLANTDFFTSTKNVPLGPDFLLRGIIPDLIETEAKMYLHNTSDATIKKFLPNHYVENENDALEKLHFFIKGYLLRYFVPFCLVAKQNNIPLGYIICNSPTLTNPITKQPMGEWSVDFWLIERIRGKGLMPFALNGLFKYLNEMEIPSIAAFVHEQNQNSISVLNKHNFKLDSISGDINKYSVKFSR